MASMAACAALGLACAESKPAQRGGGAGGGGGETMVTQEQSDAIDSLFRRRAHELHTCWSQEYERSGNRKLEGDVTVGLTVTPSGAPADLKLIKSTFAEGDVANCVVHTVGGWTFPEVNAPLPYVRTVHLGAEY